MCHTGELLCRQVPEYVNGYIERIPPCLWSDVEGDGLPRPPVLTADTRLVGRSGWHALVYLYSLPGYATPH